MGNGEVEAFELVVSVAYGTQVHRAFATSIKGLNQPRLIDAEVSFLSRVRVDLHSHRSDTRDNHDQTVSAAQLNRLAQRLARDLPGFGVKGRLLYVSPVGHSIRGVLLERSSHANRFYVNVFLQPLCIRQKTFALNAGKRINPATGSWSLDRPDLLEQLSRTVREDIAPQLLALQSPRDVALAAKAFSLSGDPMVRRTIAYAFARNGDVSQSLRELNRLLSFLEEYGQTDHEWFREATLLKSLLETDPHRAETLLLKWETATAEALGFKK